MGLYFSTLTIGVNMKVLTLPVKREYFDLIKSGDKPEEYRIYNDFWIKRIVGKDFDGVEITKGYPKLEDSERRLKRPWMGYIVKDIVHPHFNNTPVRVFAIKVN